MAISVFEQYRCLWKNTFGDSDEYLDIIESTYFRQGNILVEQRGDKVVAGMLTIPYHFAGGRLRGLYLCGLCTSAEYREQGIMSRLIDTAANKAKDDGFDFLFLIPKDEKLMNYYSKRSFVNGCFRQIERYSSLHNFMVGDKNIIVKYFYSENDIIDKLCRFIEKCENNEIASINHSMGDIKAVINENVISSGRIVYAMDENNNICGVAFVEFHGEDELKIIHIYEDKESVEEYVLKFVKEHFPTKPITIYKYPKYENLLSRRNYYSAYDGLVEKLAGSSDANVASTGDVEPYAMFRLLNHGRILAMMGSEGLLSDVMVMNADRESFTRYIAKNGGMEIREGKISNLSNPSDVFDEMSLSRFIWRHPSDDKLVEEAMGISRLPSDICLMLD